MTTTPSETTSARWTQTSGEQLAPKPQGAFHDPSTILFDGISRKDIFAYPLKTGERIIYMLMDMLMDMDIISGSSGAPPSGTSGAGAGSSSSPPSSFPFLDIRYRRF